jgi:hypothetical protein
MVQCMINTIASVSGTIGNVSPVVQRLTFEVNFMGVDRLMVAGGGGGG